MSHLTIKERLKIELWLNEGRNFQEIADSLEKARSTIVRGVRKHRT
jgi:IS30 family transposase